MLPSNFWTDAKQSALLTGEVPFCESAMFNNLDENRIRQAALRTTGSCGPSGMDANGWRHILASKSFGKVGKELCAATADFAKILYRRDIFVQPERSSSLEAYVACRLITLNKKPGVRPIGVGEILRRIVGKAIVAVVKPKSWKVLEVYNFVQVFLEDAKQPSMPCRVSSMRKIQMRYCWLMLRMRSICSTEMCFYILSSIFAHQYQLR